MKVIYCLHFVLVSVFSYTTRDCWDRYPEEWAYFPDIYLRMYTTHEGLEDVMNCMHWIYSKSENTTEMSDDRHEMDGCQLCSYYVECVVDGGAFFEDQGPNRVMTRQNCLNLYRYINKMHSIEEEVLNSSEKPYLVARDQIRKHICSPSYLYVKSSGHKGRGLYTKVDIPKDSYVVYYNGRWTKENPRQDQSYTFQLILETKFVWIDAYEEDGSYGRLMNDEHINPNLVATIVQVDGLHHIAFFALRDIKAGEELSFHYGRSNLEYPWRKNTNNNPDVDEEVVDEDEE